MPASTRLAPERVDALAPWPLERAVPYRPDYLAGHQTLRYDVEPDQGLAARSSGWRRSSRTTAATTSAVTSSAVSSMDVRYADVMFKLVLLPIWVAAYLHAGRTYQVFVNAHTGEVVGERPYSVPKIVAAVVAGLIVVAVLLYFYARTHQGG